MWSEQAGVIVRLVDTVFGFLVWAAHLLAVYVGAALFCALTRPSLWRDAAFPVSVALVGATALSFALIGFHVLRHIGPQRKSTDQQFLSLLALAIDGVAGYAIAAQAIPILMTPLCQ